MTLKSEANIETVTDFCVVTVPVLKILPSLIRNFLYSSVIVPDITQST